MFSLHLAFLLSPFTRSISLLCLPGSHRILPNCLSRIFALAFDFLLRVATGAARFIGAELMCTFEESVAPGRTAPAPFVVRNGAIVSCSNQECNAQLLLVDRPSQAYAWQMKSYPLTRRLLPRLNNFGNHSGGIPLRGFSVHCSCWRHEGR